jgi:hypothetical protein
LGASIAGSASGGSIGNEAHGTLIDVRTNTTRPRETGVARITEILAGSNTRNGFVGVGIRATSLNGASYTLEIKVTLLHLPGQDTPPESQKPF